MVVLGTNKVGFVINEEINPTETKSVGIQLVIKVKELRILFSIQVKLFMQEIAEEMI
jgi:hypothetical protein